MSPVNDSPSVLDLAISPAVPDFGDNLVVTYSFSDIDGDTESGTVIQWYKSGSYNRLRHQAAYPLILPHVMRSGMQ